MTDPELKVACEGGITDLHSEVTFILDPSGLLSFPLAPIYISPVKLFF